MTDERHILSLDWRKLFGNKVSEEEIQAVGQWVDRDPDMRRTLHSFVAHLKQDRHGLLEAIALAEKEQREQLERRYKNAPTSSDGIAEHDLSIGYWTAQHNTEGMNTCGFASGVNALRSLMYGQYTEQSLIDALGGNSFARQNSGEGATTEEIAEAIRKQNPKISVTQTTSVSELLHAVEHEKAAAIVPLGIGHVGTIPSRTRVFREAGVLKIPTVDSIGPRVVNQPVIDIIRSDITFARGLKQTILSSALIVRTRTK